MKFSKNSGWCMDFIRSDVCTGEESDIWTGEGCNIGKCLICEENWLLKIFEKLGAKKLNTKYRVLEYRIAQVPLSLVPRKAVRGLRPQWESFGLFLGALTPSQDWEFARKFGKYLEIPQIPLSVQSDSTNICKNIACMLTCMLWSHYVLRQGQHVFLIP